MAINTLSTSVFGNEVVTIDWDDVADTLGATVSGTTLTSLTVSVTIGGTTHTVDGATVANQILNKGRQVIIGPGSIIGHNTPVTSIPAHTTIGVSGSAT